MARTGRPRIDIKRDIFEGLCRLQCTRDEIWGVLGVSEPTLLRWVKRTYGANTNFDTVRESLSQVGKMSLRRAMFKNAEEGNAQVQIFLAKNHLGMAEKVEIDHRIESEIERELARLAAAGEAEVPRAAETDTDARLIN